MTTTDVMAHSESITYSSQTDASEGISAVRTYRTDDPQPWIWIGWAQL